MKDLRLWSAALAVSWFLVGLGTGVAVSRQTPSPSPLAGYADALSEEFELSSRRRRVLNQLLDEYESRQREIRTRHQVATLDAMEPDFRALDAEFDDKIRNSILPPAARARYDALARPLAAR
ncbi:MAG: hypothetical protein PVJ89_07815 [Planctomycetota bacterium]